jgi:hypothetical protein
MSNSANAALAGPWKDLWNGDLSLTGGFPGAAPDAVGRHVTFTGTDTLRIADGKLAEYWANADSLLFFQQLGVREVPAQG